MSDEEEEDVKELEVEAIIGFDGSIIKGFRIHPDKIHVVYPLGNKVTIQNWTTKQQYFLKGHTNVVSAIDISSSGKYIASGQINHIGFKAWVYIWDFETKTVLQRHEIHKVRVEAVAFSNDDSYVLSLGGRDCGNVVVWDIALGQAVCGTQVCRGFQGEALLVVGCNIRPMCFLTAGEMNVTIWIIDKLARNITGTTVGMSKLKRTVLCMDLDERDEMCYCGTSTGDVLKIRLNFHHDPDVLEIVKKPLVIGCFARISQKKIPKGTVLLYENGVRAIYRTRKGVLIIGAGDGTLEMVVEAKCQKVELPVSIAVPSIPGLEILQSTNLKHMITSIQDTGNKELLVSTVKCEIFLVDQETFEVKLLLTCHTDTIYDISFPNAYSEVFATASKHDVRIWNLTTCQELLRIQVPNFSCSAVIFAYDGKSIITAWNDGIIRAFTPLTGRLIYAILNAHNKGVSALSITRDGRTLISGGCEGQVRLWKITPTYQQWICTLKEHKGPVSAIDINKTDDEAVSASTDGTCIIWDLDRQIRKAVLFANTLFMSVKYFTPNCVQILTGGTDRKICYWEVLDGTKVRELEGSRSGSINSIDISADGKNFVTGGNDELVLLWNYDEGVKTHFGFGHSAIITCCKFSPDSRVIVTTSASGSIFIWKNPMAQKVSEEKTVEKAPEKVSNEENIKDLPTQRSSVSIVSGSGDGELCPCVCRFPLKKKK